MSSQPQTHTFQVTMTCAGCSGAVERVLKRVPEVTQYDISLETQLVKVTTTLPKEKVLEVIKKTGKEVKEV